MNNIDPNISKFRNTLVAILNIMNRYNGGHNIDGKEFPLIETFDVDEVYDVIDLIYNKFNTDKDFDKDEFIKFYKSEFLGLYNNLKGYYYEYSCIDDRLFTRMES